jgi:hypothetical protein
MGRVPTTYFKGRDDCPLQSEKQKEKDRQKINGDRRGRVPEQHISRVVTIAPRHFRI